MESQVGVASDQLRLMADAYPAEVAFKVVHTGDELTFGHWERRSNQVARGLAGIGVERGDRVGIYLPPQRALDWVVCYEAIHKAGAVVVALNDRLAEPEVEHIVAHAEARAVIAGAELAPTLRAVRSRLPRLGAIVDEIESLLALEGSTYQVEVSPDDLADIMYTSGTTGRPKGVAVTHRNLSPVPTARPTWTGGSWLCSSPLFTFAGVTPVHTSMRLGLTALYQPRFDVDQWIDAVERERPAMTFLVPAMAELLVAHPRFAHADLSSLALVAIGSAPLSGSTLRKLRARLPAASVTNNYNLTESGSAFFALPPDQAEERFSSIGRPVPPTEVRVVGDDGADLAPGQVGELLLRVPGKMREYYRDPESTAATWREGWLASGDLARLDDEGYVYIVGRKKDMIIRGGNNIYAADVEAALFEHPAVEQAAVAGIPHPVLGEDVAAWVVLRDRVTASTDELRAHCTVRLADYKVPRRITLVDALPRNPTGKVLKHLLV